jgi:hypothetical protein
LNQQYFTLDFVSDGVLTYKTIIGDFWGFKSAVDAYLTAVGNGLVTEVFNEIKTLAPQTLFNYSGIVVTAQSDAVPIPASAILFGAGLLGFVPVWWLRRKA